MQAALKLQTTVLPGHRIEVAAPELPEGSHIELLIYRLPDSAQEAAETSLPVYRYPEALNAEYERLINTQWQRDLTAEEAARLEEVKAEINAIDAASGSGQIWEQRIATLREQLAALRRDVENLPDAS